MEILIADARFTKFTTFTFVNFVAVVKMFTPPQGGVNIVNYKSGLCQ